MPAICDATWPAFLQRYRRGEWRAPVFRDLILSDAAAIWSQKPALLDIGCGKGFDGDAALQRSLAQAAGAYLGVEPDPDITLEPIFTEAHRCPLEEAPLAPESVDVAFAVMVLEHLEHPEVFWNKVHTVLKPGGVFWGFTMDARHWFVTASLLAKRLRLKDYYLNVLHGDRGRDRYENYPVHYRSNSPRDVLVCARAFSDLTILNFTKVGQLDYYLPQWLRPLGRAIDRSEHRRQKPGSLLAVRAVK